MKPKTLTFFAVSFVMLMVWLMPAAVSADTLEVGPGKTYATIQAAVDAAQLGNTILVYPDPASYAESVSVTKSHLRIIAQGDGVVVEPPNTAGFQVNADHVTIRGFEIAYGADCAPAIDFEGSHNAFAQNTIYLGASCIGANAVVCRDDDGGSNHNTIADNTIDAADLGIVMVARSPTAINAHNVIENNTLKGVAQSPIVVANGSHFLVSGNSIDAAPFGHCISVGTFSDNNVRQGHHKIVKNTMGYCAGNGISLYAAPGTVLGHNRISDNTIQICGEDCIALEAGSGAALTDNRVSENETSFSEICGITLGANPWEAVDASVSKNTVRANTAYRNLSGICLNPGANQNSVSKNDAQDNTSDGIVVFSNHNRITGNTAHDNDRDGIEVHGNNNKIRKNTALHNGSYDLFDSGSGNTWRRNTYDTSNF